MSEHLRKPPEVQRALDSAAKVVSLCPGVTATLTLAVYPGGVTIATTGTSPESLAYVEKLEAWFLDAAKRAGSRVTS